MKRKEIMYKVLLGAAAVFCIVAAYLSVFFGSTRGQAYYLGLILLLPGALVAVYLYQRMTECSIINRMREEWGNRVKRKRNFEEIMRVFEYRKEERPESFHIDNQTWDDLNMDDVFALLDRTLTTPGEQVLYDMLRTPVMEEEVLRRRGKIIKILQEEGEIREALHLKLHMLGRQREGSAASLMWEETPPQSPFRPLFSIMALGALIAVLSTAFIGIKALILFVLPLFGVNFLINYKVRKKVLMELTSVRYLAALINTAEKVVKVKQPGFADYSGALDRAYSACRKIINRVGNLVPFQANDMAGAFYEYVNILFLIEVRSFYSVLNEIKTRREDLKSIYLLLGELDVFLSIASYRTGIGEYVEPEFVAGGAVIDILDARHPLLEDPVANSITIREEGIIVTGCNMSGKSTFLRTLGVNALFAQTIFTCLASSYKGSRLKVITSISRGDNLVGGKSYYLAEAEALLRIIRESQEAAPCLCIIDEMFRGTNSLERINASCEILRYLVGHNCLVVIATHDYELVEMVGELYKCYYFSEKIREEGISFDYRIKEGASKNRNAVRLMDYLGYPREIIEKVNSRVEAVTGSQNI